MAGYMKLIKGTIDKYQFEVSHGFDGKGKRKKFYKTVTVKHKKDASQEEIEKAAERQLAVFESEVKKGEVKKPTRTSFINLVEKWRESPDYKNLAPKTAFRYEELLRLHIVPVLGNYKLEDITADTLDEAYNEFRKPRKRTYTKKDGTTRTKEYTLSERTVRHCHNVISILINRALEKRNIKENPLIGADIPMPEEKKAKSYSDQDIEVLKAALEGEKDIQFRTCIHVLLSSGARLGEIMGLTWNNVNFAESAIFIEQTSQYLPHKGTFTKETPKNESSIRSVGLPEAVMDMLSELQHQQKVRKVELGNKWVDSGFVFVNQNGSRMYVYSYSKVFNKFLKRNNLPPLTVHGLRHTSASYLIDAGESFINVAERLGHKDTSMLVKRYGHKFKKGDKSAVSKISTLYAKKESSENKAN